MGVNVFVIGTVWMISTVKFKRCILITADFCIVIREFGHE